MRHLALQDDAELGLVGGDLYRRVEQRLVVHDASGLHAARGRDDDFRLGVVDANGKLVGGKTAEHHRMNCPEPRRSEHGDERLRHHRHVDDDAVALGYAFVGKHGGEGFDLVKKLAEGEGPLRSGHRTVVDERGLVSASLGDVPIEAIVGGVAFAADEPAAIESGLVVKHLVERLVPMDV